MTVWLDYAKQSIAGERGSERDNSSIDICTPLLTLGSIFSLSRADFFADEVD